MKTEYLVQYMHPFHRKWITEERCSSLNEAYDILHQKQNEVKGLRRDKHGTLHWRVSWD